MGLVFSELFFTYNVAEATKPKYCDEALKRCLDLCGSGDLASMGCKLGCWIAYQSCGT